MRSFRDQHLIIFIYSTLECQLTAAIPSGSFSPNCFKRFLFSSIFSLRFNSYSLLRRSTESALYECAFLFFPCWYLNSETVILESTKKYFFSWKTSAFIFFDSAVNEKDKKVSACNQARLTQEWFIYSEAFYGLPPLIVIINAMQLIWNWIMIPVEESCFFSTPYMRRYCIAPRYHLCTISFVRVKHLDILYRPKKHSAATYRLNSGLDSLHRLGKLNLEQ